MPFFKRDGDTLQTATAVYAPDCTLTEETQADHTYPMDGWWWFATLDDAMAALRTPDPTLTCSAAQGRLALLQAGLLDTVEGWAATQDRAVQIEYEARNEWRRDWPLVIDAAGELGLTDAQLDDLFTLAMTL
jgi:hypothetical protein